MGFNTLMMIENKDLPAIEDDEGFGKAIHAAATYADRAFRARGRGDAVRLSEIEDMLGLEFPYGLQAADAHHASSTTANIIYNGNLSTLGFANNPQWGNIEAAAEAFSLHGYRIEHKKGKYLVEAKPVSDLPPMEADRAWMSDFDQSVFDEGSTAFLVLNDGLHDIRDQKDMGKHFVAALKEWWAGSKHISNLYCEKPEAQKTTLYLSDSVGAGNHANPIQIVSVTPRGVPELVAAGGNWGRTLRPHLPFSIVNRMISGNEEHLLKIRKDDLTQVKQNFLEMGFHVRTPGRTRAESPAHWAKEYWVEPEKNADNPEP
ncbi:hypothetical protein [Pseudosulfitobacter pseudonitzschiae]|uniref:hypothetical protein n=1 Tax=Pseudosulfitobacter pseudonitzschiae TaxID=1402135 RepID=UPI003B7B95BA